MYILLLIVYLVLVIVMIGVILIQEPRTSGGLGIAFGGGVENVLGVKSAPTFFTNFTIGLGVTFGVLAFILSMMAGVGRAVPVVQKEAGKGTIYKVLQELQQTQQPPQPAPNK